MAVSPIRVIVAVVAAAAVAAAVWWGVRDRTSTPPMSIPLQPEITKTSPTATPTISGTYADDWQTRCGPLTGKPQEECTATLDAAYGHQAEVAVPKN